MRDLRSDGSSASPMPKEVFQVQFCKTFEWTWWEYYNTPDDVIYRFARINGMIENKLADLRGDGDDDAVYMDDND